MSLGKIIAAICAVVVAASLLAGCGPSRKSVHRGGGAVSADSRRPVGQAYDYSRGVDDPMAHALISNAQGWIGTRYLYGGAQRSGTDCSGLVMTVYNEVTGVKIPRTTREQVRYCTRVARNRMQPGDLVFFAQPVKADAADPEMVNDEIYGLNDFGAPQSQPAVERVSHVGLYVGDGRMIHASSSRGVIVSSIDSGYWGDRYVTGARVDGAPKAYASLHGGRKSPHKPEPVPASGSRLTPEPQLQAEVAPAAPVSAPAPASTIDLLDLLINAKVDSIVSSQIVTDEQQYP